MRFFIMLCALLTSAVWAKNDVEFARDARSLLWKTNNVGRGEEVICKDVEKVRFSKKVTVRECKTTAFDKVLIVVKQPSLDFKFIVARMDTCSSLDEEFKVRCVRDRFGNTNGLNTHFVVEHPYGFKVYAIRRLGMARFGREEMVYSPYSDELNTPIVIDEGRKYLDKVVDEAYADLRIRGIQSRSFPGRLVADVVPKDVIRTIALIEHMDEQRFLDEGAAKLVSEVHATLALNQDGAYSLGASSASARGLFQFTLKTYLQMVTVYPGAGLVRDFFPGANHHVNAGKAAVLLLDHDLSLLQPKEREAVLGNRHAMLGFFASTYNGGPSCPKSVNRHGLCAIQMYRKFSDFAKQNPNRENRIYVEKMYAVDRLLKTSI